MLPHSYNVIGIVNLIPVSYCFTDTATATGTGLTLATCNVIVGIHTIGGTVSYNVIGTVNLILVCYCFTDTATTTGTDTGHM